MNKVIKLGILAVLMATTFMGCKDPENHTTTEVKVTTYSATEITATTAQAGGHVTVTGEATITELGLCWSMEKNPTTEDTHTSTTTTNEPFNCTLTGLQPETTYHIRAYAIGGSECYYGEDLSFTTLAGASQPQGLLSGVFTAGSGKKIRFSQGNLQYQASTNTWRFAESQLDFIGNANANISENYGGWIDLFAWGTSGFNHGAVCYQPWTIGDNSDYYAYGSYNYGLFDQNGQADWGYNAISNGGNQTGLWRTFTNGDLGELFEYRETPSGIRFAMACVGDANGVLLFPDDWIASLYTINEPNRFETGEFAVNAISASDWNSILEPAGVVFLPAAGMRSGTEVVYPNGAGSYWSSSNYNSYAYCLLFIPTEGGDPDAAYDRNFGFSVRLVQDYEE